MGGINHVGRVEYSFFKRITAKLGPSSLTSQPPLPLSRKENEREKLSEMHGPLPGHDTRVLSVWGRPPQTRNKSTRVVKNRRRRRQRDRSFSSLVWRGMALYSYLALRMRPPSYPPFCASEPERKTMPTAEGSGNNILCGFRRRCRSTYESDAAVSLEQKPSVPRFLRCLPSFLPSYPSFLPSWALLCSQSGSRRWRRARAYGAPWERNYATGNPPKSAFSPTPRKGRETLWRMSP